MFHWTMTARGCRKYRARIEDCLKNDVQFPSEPPSRDILLEAHLSGCKRCRAALEDARLARELVRNGSAPLAVAPYGFERRVMAAISEETARRMGLGIWRPSDLLALCFGFLAAVGVLA